MEEDKKFPAHPNDQELKISAELGRIMSSINSALYGLDGVNNLSTDYQDALDFFLRSLPDRPRAEAFCDSYIDHFCYILRYFFFFYLSYQRLI